MRDLSTPKKYMKSSAENSNISLIIINSYSLQRRQFAGSRLSLKIPAPDQNINAEKSLIHEREPRAQK